MDGEPAALFVYGTLKRGEVNHDLLAPHAVSIEYGWIAGRLHDLGDYPALIVGDDRVHGEIARFDPAAMRHILPVIDRLEHCLPGDDARSLYLRRIVEVTTPDEHTEPALTYYYNAAHPSLPAIDGFPPIPSGEWTGVPPPVFALSFRLSLVE